MARSKLSNKSDKTIKTDIIMRYNREKREYVRPEVAEILLHHDAILLSVSSELGKDIYIDEEEEEQDDVVFG